MDNLFNNISYCDPSHKQNEINNLFSSCEDLCVHTTNIDNVVAGIKFLCEKDGKNVSTEILLSLFEGNINFKLIYI